MIFCDCTVGGTLVTLYYGAADDAAEERIFTICFTGAAPAWVAAHVNNGGEYIVGAFGAGFAGDVIVNVADHSGVPAAGEGN